MSDQPTGEETYQLPDQYIYGAEPPPPPPAAGALGADADSAPPNPASPPTPAPPARATADPSDDEIDPPIERHDPSTTCAAPGG